MSKEFRFPPDVERRIAKTFEGVTMNVNPADVGPVPYRPRLSETTKCWLATIAIMAVATAFIVFMAAYGPQGGGR